MYYGMSCTLWWLLIGNNHDCYSYGIVELSWSSRMMNYRSLLVMNANQVFIQFCFVTFLQFDTWKWEAADWFDRNARLIHFHRSLNSFPAMNLYAQTALTPHWASGTYSLSSIDIRQQWRAIITLVVIFFHFFLSVLRHLWFLVVS